MKAFYDALASIVSTHTGVDQDQIAKLFSRPPDAKMGDLSLPCFAFSKALRKDPKSIADDLAGLDYGLPWVASAQTAGPYVNFRFHASAFSRTVLEQVRSQGSDFGGSDQGAGRSIVIDYSSPNIAKHLAVHHLRSTMIGNSIANLHRALGYEVVGINHLGDWGTTYGKLLCAWEHFGGDLEKNPLSERDDALSALNELYVRFHKESESHPELEDEARSWFQRLEAGDDRARERWEEIRNTSLARFEGIYQRLGVSFEEVIGESFFEDKMQAVIDELEEKGLLVESDEAQVVRLDEWDMPPLLIRKKDGATLYATRDLAAADYRFQRWGFERCYYVVDAGQGLHFRQLFKVLELLGREYADRMRHIEFGVMRLPVDGAWVRGKTRDGQVVLLEAVLDKARDLARGRIQEKNPDLVEIEEAADAVGLASVVFADLKAKRIKDVNFDLEQITSFEGETGAYLEYTHVRFCSIVRKYCDRYEGGLSTEPTFEHLTTPEDVALVKEIARYPMVLERAVEDVEPSVVSQYLLGLGAEFNSYYHVHRILDDDPAVARDRVGLVEALRTVLANGMRILGIRPLERM